MIASRAALVAALLAGLGGCHAGSGADPPERTVRPGKASDLDLFLAWLRARGGEDERYVLARFSTRSRYQMSGHAWSAFFGVSEFLRRYPDLAAELAQARFEPRLFWAERPRLRQLFAEFVRTEGHLFPGQNGGAWGTKLPIALGGTQASGGAGSGLVARMLILVARYGSTGRSSRTRLHHPGASFSS